MTLLVVKKVIVTRNPHENNRSVSPGAHTRHVARHVTGRCSLGRARGGRLLRIGVTFMRGVKRHPKEVGPRVERNGGKRDRTASDYAYGRSEEGTPHVSGRSERGVHRRVGTSHRSCRTNLGGVVAGSRCTTCAGGRTRQRREEKNKEWTSTLVVDSKTSVSVITNPSLVVGCWLPGCLCVSPTFYSFTMQFGGLVVQV